MLTVVDDFLGSDEGAVFGALITNASSSSKNEGTQLYSFHSYYLITPGADPGIY